LIGKPPAEFNMVAAPHTPLELPVIPVGLPTSLLERRPDIAAGERRVAEANDQIGIARAAYFPSLMIGATGGFTGTSITNWLNWPSRMWAVGPQCFRPMVPDFLHGAPPTGACAAFIKESRMKFVNARELDRKSGCTLGRTLAQLDQRIARLDKAAEQAADAHPQASLLMQQKGVGPITALAFALTIGDVSRFEHSNQVASYLGLIPSEHTSSSKRRLGSITKQGNSFLRMLLVEAAQSVTRLDPQFHKHYVHLCRNKPKAVAKVAAARKLAVRLYWVLRTDQNSQKAVPIESSPRVPLVGAS
jgi:hypothetical protein